jgi:methionyl aminopeptidase
LILIKTKKEIDYIKDSCRIVAETLRLLKANVKPGITTSELAQIADDYILSNGAKSAFKGYSQGGDSIDYPGAICVSVDSEVVHGIPGNRVLRNGEIVSVDVGVEKNGFFGDAALTAAVGVISEEKQKLLDVTQKSLMNGIEEAVSGNPLHNISAAIQEYVEENGFSIVRDLCGHGVGKYLHEAPSIPNYGKRGTGVKLKSGMTLAIEPMVNAGSFRVKVEPDGWTVVTTDGMPSAHFEHTILITNGKPEILTAQ